jgi:hypothetical protein
LYEKVHELVWIKLSKSINTLKAKTDINFIFCTLQIIHYASIIKTKFSSCSSRVKIKWMLTLRLRSPSVRQSVKQYLAQLPDFQEIKCRSYLQNVVEQVCVLWKIVQILQWGNEFLLLVSIFLGRYGWKSVHFHIMPLSECEFLENQYSESHILLRDAMESTVFTYCPIWLKLGIRKSTHNSVEYLWVSWKTSLWMDVFF